MKNHQKELRVLKSKINKVLKNQTLETTCKLCNKEIKMTGKGFHTSHGIPQFVLHKISGRIKGNYRLATINSINGFQLLETDNYIGAKNAGIFYLICSECDQYYFHIYESEEVLMSEITSKQLSSISLKIALKEYYDSFYKKILSAYNFDDERVTRTFVKDLYKVHGEIYNLVSDKDLADFDLQIERYKSSFLKDEDLFEVVYQDILPYTVPIAAQVEVNISHDLNFKKIQDITTKSNDELQNLTIIIFPLENKSLVLVYRDMNHKLLDSYVNQFKKLTSEEKLREIFYLLIRYKQSNYYLSPGIVHTLIDDAATVEVSSYEDGIIATNFASFDLAIFENRTLRTKIINILTEDYSTHNLK